MGKEREDERVGVVVVEEGGVEMVTPGVVDVAAAGLDLEGERAGDLPAGVEGEGLFSGDLLDEEIVEEMPIRLCVGGGIGFWGGGREWSGDCNVDESDEMTGLTNATSDIGHDSDQFIDLDVMTTPLLV
jgi:hypothetical protein